MPIAVSPFASDSAIRCIPDPFKNDQCTTFTAPSEERGEWHGDGAIRQTGNPAAAPRSDDYAEAADAAADNAVDRLVEISVFCEVFWLPVVERFALITTEFDVACELAAEISVDCDVFCDVRVETPVLSDVAMEVVADAEPDKPADAAADAPTDAPAVLTDVMAETSSD